MIEPIRVTERLKPAAVTNPRPGIYVVDFGQSFYGVVRLKVSGPAGTEVRLRTSFNVMPDGLLNVSNDRSALNIDTYTLKGQGVETWHPRFKRQRDPVGAGRRVSGHAHRRELRGAGRPHRHGAGRSVHLLQRVDQPDLQNARWGTRMQNRSVPMEPDRDERMPWSGHPAKTSESEG